MTQFTTKQQAFIDNKAAGVRNREAAIAAGYAPNSAAVAADKLMLRDDVKAAIQASAGVVTSDAKHTMPRTTYSDPMQFLVDVMNHPHLPIAARADAAKTLLPYQHGKIGEIGKKQQAKERARDAVGRGGSRLIPKSPPVLRSV